MTGKAPYDDHMKGSTVSIVFRNDVQNSCISTFLAGFFSSRREVLNIWIGFVNFWCHVAFDVLIGITILVIYHSAIKERCTNFKNKKKEICLLKQKESPRFVALWEDNRLKSWKPCSFSLCLSHNTWDYFQSFSVENA